MEQTFLMIKPDGVQRGLIGEIVCRFEKKGLQLCAAKFMKLDEELARRHYAEHEGKPFYPPLIDFILSGPVFAMVWKGDQAIGLTRALIGKTDALAAAPGTIRSDFGVHTNFNLIHGSDSVESAQREIALYFKPEELLDYEHTIQRWI
ncbi:nucleoside-diphosphate kinase [Paenibacillus pinihumi]|uniref:nucleoside-diphosphate kinase n=1 Tax=Paenibacillus pinihumi TaxID=669462 RepID=UPI000491997F|nr:nucleoside-diphosphate kinase [Paenibacillus pinihumi]